MTLNRASLHLLSQTGPNTLTGQLLRTFWQPIAIANSLLPGTARGITILGEELTLYRGDSGEPHLVGGRCAHRCTLLHTGWVKGDQIRCMYHGWQYDESGRCIEMPAEPRLLADVKIASYPVHEYVGLIFAYLGEGRAPEFDLPRKDALEAPGKQLFAYEAVWDCNWAQLIENSLDAVHVSFVHQWGGVDGFGAGVTTAIPELKYEETSAGIRQTAIRAKDNIRVSDWTFPNNNHIIGAGIRPSEPWWHAGTWSVPIDDQRTLKLSVRAVEPGTETARNFVEAMPCDYNPADHREQIFNEHIVPPVKWTVGLGLTQDYVALRGQGTIVDRTKERLVSSDAGIAFLRRILFRELEAISEGRPTKHWRRLDEAVHLLEPGQMVTTARRA